MCLQGKDSCSQLPFLSHLPGISLSSNTQIHDSWQNEWEMCPPAAGTCIHTHTQEKNRSVRWPSCDMLGLYSPQFHGQFESLFLNLIPPKCARPSPPFKAAVITERPHTSRAVHMMTELHGPIRPAAAAGHTRAVGGCDPLLCALSPPSSST